MSNQSIWYDRHLAGFRAEGRQDAERGVYEPPHPIRPLGPCAGRRANFQAWMEDENAEYTAGFEERRWELGKAFHWAD